MAGKKEEIDYSEIVDRSRGEWSEIYTTVSKAYGLRINRYKGKQKLVYLPDMIDGEKVVLYTEFPSGVAVICNKRLFGQLDDETQINTAVAYISNPEKFPDEFGKIPHNFILKNTKAVLKAIFEKDDVKTLEAYILLMGGKIDLDAIDEMFMLANNANGCKAYIMDFKSSKYSSKELDQIESIKLEKEIGIRERTVADWKKIFVIVNEDDGVCINGYKGEDEVVTIPERIGKRLVRSINIGFFLHEKKYPWSVSPEKIKKIIVPKGIRIGSFRDEKQARTIMQKIAVDGITNVSWRGISKELQFPEIEIVDRDLPICQNEAGVSLASNMLQPGSTIYLGRYPGASGDGSIGWVVAAVDGEKALLITRDIIEGCDSCYSYGDGIINWASNLYYFGLSNEEQRLVLVEQGKTPTFILTKELYDKYEIGDKYAAVKPSDSLLNAGADVDMDGNCPWFIDVIPLGGAHRDLMVVLPDGNVSRHEYKPNKRTGIRPAMWISISA